MGFHDIILDEELSYGSRGGPRFNTEIITTDSGYEERISRWENVRHNFNVGYGIRNYQDLADLKDFYTARRGAANTFRFKDWADYLTSVDSTELGVYQPTPTAFTDQLIDAGDGTEQNFQMIKRYTSGPSTNIRTITKPRQDTVSVGVNGVEKTEGVDYTIDYTTGIISFTVAPPNGHDVTWGGQFDNHVRFGEDADRLFELSIDAWGGGSVPTISIIEVLDTEVHVGEFLYGGSERVDISADYRMDAQSARFMLFDPDTGTENVFLPNNTSASPAGGPFHYIKHDGAAGSVVLKSPYDGSTLTTLTPGDQVTAVLHIDYVADTQQWFLFT